MKDNNARIITYFISFFVGKTLSLLMVQAFSRLAICRSAQPAHRICIF